MTEQPYATEVLLEVMEITGEDAQLPLQILMNLHRPALQAPAVSLATRLASYELRWPDATDRMQYLMQRLDREWPELNNGDLFRYQPQLDKLSNAAASHIPDAMDIELRRTQPSLQQLLGFALSGWQSYEPLAILHQLTWPEAPQATLLTMLEIELNLDPAVERMIRHYRREIKWPSARKAT